MTFTEALVAAFNGSDRVKIQPVPAQPMAGDKVEGYYFWREGQLFYRDKDQKLSPAKVTTQMLGQWRAFDEIADVDKGFARDTYVKARRDLCSSVNLVKGQVVQVRNSHGNGVFSSYPLPDCYEPVFNVADFVPLDHSEE